MTVKHTTQSVKEFVEREEYILVSDYIDSHSNITVECPEGHQYKVYWTGFQQGRRCAICRKRDRKQKQLDKIKEEFAKEGYKLLTRRYTSNSQKLMYICPGGHKGSISWSNWVYSKNRCAQCRTISYSYQDVRRKFEAEKYTLMSKEYNGAHSLLSFICPRKHKHAITLSNWNKGVRCGKCYPVHSKSEEELGKLYAYLNPIERDRIKIKPYELDLYFPSHSLAIEYCGLFWHSEAAPGDRITSSYHRNKLDLCAKKGIKLLTIFEDEWLNHKDICISRINNALGISSSRIYARNTIAKEVPKPEAKEFLNRTHLQGYGRCKLAFGLYTKDTNTLVSVMTWGSPARAHTAKGKKVLEMKRFASELDTTVIGGASKLLKLGLQYAKDNNYDSLKSYCDLRWGTGNLYKKLGFTKTYETRYTPHYTDGKQRFRNQVLATNKKKEKTTEAKKADEKGLYKIYDCGHSTWEYTIKK